MDDTCFTAFLRCPYRIEQIFTDKQQLATDLARSPRTASPGEQWCKLICARRTQFHVATRHANLPASRKPPRHRGDCAKGARQVFSQAGTGRHPLQELLHTRAFTQRRFYTQTLSHTDAFTHRPFYTQKLLHTRAFTHRPFYTQKLLPHKSFYTKTLLHRRFHTQTLLRTDPFTHRSFYTQELLHTDPFTHRSFYTQELLHKDAFTHRRFHTQTVLRTDPFTHRSFYTQELLHTTSNVHFVRKVLQNRNFSSIFDVQRPFRAKGLQSDTFFSQFFISF